jgi:hypothetical protein
MIQTTVKRKYNYITFKISVEENVFKKWDIIQNLRTKEKMLIKSVPSGKGGYFVWRNYPNHAISHDLNGEKGDIIVKVKG